MAGPNVLSPVGRRAAAGGLCSLLLAGVLLASSGPAWAFAPGPPTGVTATAGDASARVTWDPPADDGGVAITGYTVTTSGPGAPGPVNSGDTSVTVDGLTNDSAYTFTVRATNPDGDGPESAPSNEVTPTAPVVITAPGAPRNVNATAGDASARVTWDPPADDGGSPITGYTVTTNGPGAPGPISTANTSVNVDGLTNGAAYTFTVTAANIAGSGPEATSNSVTPAAPVVITIPGAPRNVNATAGDASARVTWDPPADDGGSPIIGYTVITNGSGAPGPISTANQALNVDGLTNGAAYTFMVRAINSAGDGPDSAPSNEVTPTAPLVITAPGVPRNVNATAGDASARVTWDPPADDGGSPITGYTVTTNGPGAPGPIGTANTSVNVPGLTNGSAYTFTVVAANVIGEGPGATSNEVTPTAAVTTPGAPRNVNATAGDASAQVTWNPPADNGGSLITGYTVTTNGPGAPGPMSTANTTVTVTGLTNGSSYTFTVSAANVAGSGPATTSNQVTPTAPVVITVPGAPRNVNATAGDASAKVIWDPPADNGGSPITGYTVTTNGPGAPAAISTTNMTVEVTGLTNGSTYTFTVRATNGVGPGPESAPSNLVIPTPPVVPPDAPTNAIATAGNGSAIVTWDPPADNGGSAITGYTVTASGGGAVPLPIDTTDTSVIVTGLTNGSSYTFTVQAANSAGLSPPASSNAVTPVAPPNPVPPGAATNVTAVAGNGSATVIWTAPPGTAGDLSYTVTTSGAGAVPAPIGSWATAVTVGGLTNGVAYTFTVTAANLAGVGPAVTSAAVTPGTVPGPPTTVSARAGDGFVALTWSAPAADGGLPVTSYTVTARRDGVVVASVAVSAPATEAIVGGLSNGAAYTFTVSAGNAVGTGPASTPPALAVPAASPRASGYWMVTDNGRVYAFGAAGLLGQPAAILGQWQAVDIESSPSGNGYRVLASNGRVFVYGDATHLGDANPAGLPDGESVTSLSATPSGQGYWIFTNRGRVLAFGDARFHGDLSAIALNGPVLDSVATPSGHGYYMVASDGGIFAFGDAVFHGSMGGHRLNAPVESLVPDGDGVGYWLVASDGGVFAFEAPFRGSLGGIHLNRPITGMVRFGDGYLMVGADGGIFNFSDRPFFGSLGASPPPRPIVAVAVREA